MEGEEGAAEPIIEKSKSALFSIQHGSFNVQVSPVLVMQPGKAFRPVQGQASPPEIDCHEDEDGSSGVGLYTIVVRRNAPVDGACLWHKAPKGIEHAGVGDGDGGDPDHDGDHAIAEHTKVERLRHPALALESVACSNTSGKGEDVCQKYNPQ